MVERISSCFVLFLCLMMIAASSFAETTLINVYDASGNLVSGDGQYYEYNDANQLVRVRQGDQNGTVVAEYFYDSTGQRVKKIENGVVTYYVGKHFEKQVGGTNAGNTSYYFAEGSERVAKKDPSGGVYYYHLDHLNGVNVVTNAAGAEVARSDYLPFGDTRSDSTGADKYSYTGKEKDKTDLYYFEARYNSPANRHFTQADVADPDYDDPQDLNRYAYVGNNPLSYVDYDGFKKKKKAKLSKREKYLIAHGRDPDKDKTSLKKAKKQEKNKSKLSDREEWMIAHGYDPDKDKTSLKKAIKREEEKQRQLALYARYLLAGGMQRGAGNSLMGGAAISSVSSNSHDPSLNEDDYIDTEEMEALGAGINLVLSFFDITSAVVERSKAEAKKMKYGYDSYLYWSSGGKKGKKHGMWDTMGYYFSTDVEAGLNWLLPPVKDAWTVIKYDLSIKPVQ